MPRLQISLCILKLYVSLLSDVLSYSGYQEITSSSIKFTRVNVVIITINF